MKLTAEQIAKMQAAKSAEELMALAKAEGIEMTEEEIKAQFDKLNGKLSLDELENVSGGCGDDGGDTAYDFNPGDHVRVRAGDSWAGRTGIVKGEDHYSRPNRCYFVVMDDTGTKESIRDRKLERA